jgi:hypothetical protein
MLNRAILLIAILSISFGSFSQRNADLGIRFNSADYNRIQLEFRKPLGENYYFRLGLSLGNEYQFPRRDIFAANDSIVTTRQKDLFGNHYDLRLGMERKISYDWLTFHADAIFGYSAITNRNWNYYHVLDSAGTTWDMTQENPYGPNESATVAVTSFISGGLALGLSFNFPVTNNLLLNFTGNYVGVVRFAVSQKETNDSYNEFEYSSYSVYEMYPSAGIGLRYVFKPKSEEALPAN